MRDAELSDVEDDSEPTTAPGKENQDPKQRKQLKASKSFMLENFSYKVKTTSSASSNNSDIPLRILKALRLDDERVRSTSGATDTTDPTSTNTTNTNTANTNTTGGSARRCRLSSNTYRPPVVESEVSENSRTSMKAMDSESSTHSYYETESPKRSYRSEEPCSPVTVLQYEKKDGSDDSSTQKKKVHWYKKAVQPTTADTNSTIMSSGSRRVRRGPAEYSTGSPPAQLGEAISGDLRQAARLQEDVTLGRPQTRGRSFGQELPTQGTFGQARYSTDGNMTSSYRRDSRNTHKHDSAESARSTPATSPEPHVRATATFAEHAANAGYERAWSPLIASEIPNYSRSCQDPSQKHGYSARNSHTQKHSNYQSASLFGDSGDYSGFGAADKHSAMHGGQYDRYGSPVDEYYNRAWDGANDDARSSSPDSVGHAAPNSNGYAPFDFSGFGATRPEPFASANAAASPKAETFQRKKKSSNPAQSGTPKKTHSWHMYDDGENGASAPNTKDCRWKKDGRTTVHRSGDRVTANTGKTVQILSIREVDSDDEMSLSEGEYSLLRVDPDVCLWLTCRCSR